MADNMKESAARMEKNSSSRPVIYKCSECGRFLPSLQAVASHQCGPQSTETVSQSSSSTSTSTISGSSRPVIYKCSECGRFLPSLQAVASHQCGPQSTETVSQSSSSTSTSTISDSSSVHADHEQSIWTRAATLLLISEYSKRKPKIDSGVVRKKKVFAEITEILRSHTYYFEEEQVMGRWKTLVRAYKNTKDHNAKSGNGKKNFEFESQLDEIFAKDPTVKPVITLSSAQKRSVDDDDEDDETCSDEPKEKKKRSRSAAGEVIGIFKDYLLQQKQEREKENKKREEMFKERNDILKSLVRAISKDIGDSGKCF